MSTDTTEKGLEDLIERHLLEQNEYVQSLASDYSRRFCLDVAKLFDFLEATQPEAYLKLGIGNSGLAQEKFLSRLSDQMRSRGILEVLRKGIKSGETQVKLYYPRPSSQLNSQAWTHYEANLFSVGRQVQYSNEKAKLALDMAIFINGLPLATFELKNQFTKQNVKDAIRQYQLDREASEPLFAFGRCLVHFAIDEELVYMTTELKGSGTQFLPFNKGHRDGAGNPPNPEGLKSDYLWKQVLTKASLSEILEKYAQQLEDEKKLIFPRYHQLDLVKKLLDSCRKEGTGKRYLIQHSAGSGKSNSISWLAHQLVELTDSAEGNTVFDSVVVVTDRKVLDKQIRDNIKQFAHVKGVVEAITDGSRQLKGALEDGKKVIVTTIQKFPFIVKEIQGLAEKRFAVIIDEAHSSQSGQTAAKMNVALSKAGGAEEERDLEDRILEVIEQQKLLKNASYFAFTATPKNKTLEAFGVKNAGDGKFYPFHSYTMKQAIDEGFILDVLANYTTYQSYYRLLKTVEEDPQFDTVKAKKRLKKYVEKHKGAIRRKTEIMVDHFLSEVAGKKKIDGKAKAMVVTNSIESAIRYKLAFDVYLKEVGSTYRSIVAFSGEKQVDGEKYEESMMNGFPSGEIPAQFKKTQNRFLIVAEKFQTGFDEPYLHTMYVDKVLSDVKAVQTLSRLNRCLKPWKRDTFILDFVNSAEQIREAFEPFYKTTVLSEETDLNRLNDLEDALNGFQVYSTGQVEDLMARYISDAPREELDPIINAAKDTFDEDLNLDQKIDFKAKAKGFVRAYQFLNMILPVRNVYWQSLAQFLRLLIPKLELPAEEDLSGLFASIDMESYRAEREAIVAIRLEGGGEIDPTPVEVRAGQKEALRTVLSLILAEFNQKFRTNWTDSDKVMRFLFEDLPDEVAKDQEYQNAKRHSDMQNAKITYEKKVVDKFQEIIFDQTEAYRKFTDDPDFKKWLCDTLFRMDYERVAGVERADGA